MSGFFHNWSNRREHDANLVARPLVIRTSEFVGFPLALALRVGHKNVPSP